MASWNTRTSSTHSSQTRYLIRFCGYYMLNMAQCGMNICPWSDGSSDRSFIERCLIYLTNMASWNTRTSSTHSSQTRYFIRFCGYYMLNMAQCGKSICPWSDGLSDRSFIERCLIYLTNMASWNTRTSSTHSSQTRYFIRFCGYYMLNMAHCGMSICPWCYGSSDRSFMVEH